MLWCGSNSGRLEKSAQNAYMCVCEQRKAEERGCGVHVSEGREGGHSA